MTRPGGDDGSAVIEFVTLGVLLMVPLVYLVFTMGRLQAASYAVDGAARESARAFTTASDEAQGRALAAAAVHLSLHDQGFDVDPRSALAIDCSETTCLTPAARVVTSVTLDVPLPGIPGFLRGAVPLEVTVRSSQTAVVDRFRVQSRTSAARSPDDADGEGPGRAKRGVGMSVRP